jgi:tRNA(Arg) A34 adenosine deaminase TadA
MENEFDIKVNRHVERLKKNKYQVIESEVSKKRISWFKQGCNDNNGNKPPSPRNAYELLFFKYMGLSEKDVPVLWETEKEIVWSSVNKCPTLEACKKLKLDTREVCRAVYEKSTQALVSQLDPQLRFHRSYLEIRPYSPHCKEMIIRMDFEEIMKMAIVEAKMSKSEGNKGYGAVVVLGKQILGKAHDTAITEKDPSLHAEVNAIRQAVRTSGDTNLCGAVLFSTCEPCPMCSSLAVWANVTTIAYGASIEETSRLGKSRIHISAKELIDKSPAMIEVIGNVLENECLRLMKED